MAEEPVREMESSGIGHKLPIGIPIGGTLGIIGLILLLDGLFGTADLRRSLGININLWWGLLMLAFGIAMTGINYLLMQRSSRYIVSEEPERARGG